MGNEHFWQVPRAKGVYARSITKHARARESSSSGRYQRTTSSADGQFAHRGNRRSRFTRYV